MQPILAYMRDCVDEQNLLDEQKLSYRLEDPHYLQALETKTLKYRFQAHEELVNFLYSGRFSEGDKELIREFIHLIRRHFLLNATFKTIQKSYQEMCAFMIALSLQRNDRSGVNFLKYFDPDSSYYLRIKALYTFRLLKDPVAQIEQIFPEVVDLLREAFEKEPKNLTQILEILKEYIERVFALTRKTLDARAKFISDSTFESWKNWCAIPEFGAWLLTFLGEEKEQDIREVRELREPSAEDFLESDRHLDTKALEDYIAHQNKMIADLNATIQTLQEQYTNVSLVQNRETIQPTSLTSTSVRLDREFYKIMIVGGGEKANKAYKNLQKEKPDFLKEFDLEWKQLSLEGDYNAQQDKYFAKKVKDALLLENIDFVLALQTDHESPFANLLKDPDVAHRITVFAERESGGENPVFSGQKFSQERFRYYLHKALEKFEREKINTQNACS